MNITLDTKVGTRKNEKGIYTPRIFFGVSFDGSEPYKTEGPWRLDYVENYNSKNSRHVVRAMEEELRTNPVFGVKGDIVWNDADDGSIVTRIHLGALTPAA